METKSEIFSQRLVTAVIWNVSLQSLIAVALVFLIQLDLLHPMTWISSAVQDILSWKMMFNIFLLGLVSFFQAFIYGTYYTTPIPKYFTRFSILMNLFTVQNIIFSVLYSLSGYFTMTLYSSLAKTNYYTLKKMCLSYEGQCLLEQSLFLQLGGLWMGLYYFLKLYIFGTTILMFPFVHQDKFQQIKLAVSNILSEGFKNSSMPVFYYCIFYFIWGNKPRTVISDLYGLYLEDPALDNIFNMLSSGIWIGLWFYTSLFFISVYTMRTVFNIVLTEPMVFPIMSDTSLVLHEALAQRSQFNSYLGAQDLKIMSTRDVVRRAQIFTLSQPGGHPRNWNNILEKCLVTITSYTKELEIINDVNPEAETQRKAHSSPNLYTFKGNLRNLANSPQLFELKDHNRNQVEQTFSEVAKAELNMFMNKLCQKPGINYFFGELHDTKLKFLLMQAQPVMWTCEGLAFIVSASLREDKYGVVQNDLSTVLSALIKLKHNLDKLTKVGLVPRKNLLNDTYAIKMRSALTSAVKKSIYKIVFTFKDYLAKEPFDHELNTAIEPFLEWREA